MEGIDALGELLHVLLLELGEDGEGKEAVGTHVLHEVLGTEDVVLVVEEDAGMVGGVDGGSEVDEVLGVNLEVLDEGKGVALVVGPVAELLGGDDGEDVLGEVLEVLGNEGSLNGGRQDLEAAGIGTQAGEVLGFGHLGGDEDARLGVVLDDGFEVGTTHGLPFSRVDGLELKGILDVGKDVVGEFGKLLAEIVFGLAPAKFSRKLA